MPGYPIELDLTGRRVLVVGLGTVGRRRAEGLVAAGAEVLGVDPVPRDVPQGVMTRAEPFRPEHLRDVVLAIASAPPEVNRRVVAAAREAGIWVNAAGGPESGTVRIPAVWRDGPLTVSVSTGGASPALAAMVRDWIAEALGPAPGGLAALLAELRPLVHARVADPARRRRVLADWSDPRWLDLWRDAGPEAVRRRLLAALDDER
jgi:siroheme synthase-like protein